MSLLKRVWNITFALWFISAFVLGRSGISMAMLALFCSYSACMMIIYKTCKFSPIFLFYLLFTCVGFINIELGLSISPSLSKELMTTLCRNLFFIICIYNYAKLVRIASFKQTIIYSSVICSICLLLLVYMYTGSFVLRNSDDSINPNSLAVCDAIIICWLTCGKKESVKYKPAIIVICALFCLLAGTKKALLATLIGISVFVLLNKPSKIVKNVILISLVSILGYAVLINVPFFYDLIGNRLEGLFSLLTSGEGDSSSNSRYNYIDLGLYHFNNRPILGHGINCFQTLKGAYGSYSHNNYVELLFSLGIVGFLCYYMMYIYVLFSAIKQYRTRRISNLSIAISFIIICLMMDFAWVSYYSRSTYMYITICLLLIDESRNYKPVIREKA